MIIDRKSGTNFFEDCRKNVLRLVYPEDIPRALRIWEKDQPKYFGLGGKQETVKLKEYAAIIKANKPLQHLMVAGGGCKLALSVATNISVLIMLYSCMMGDYDGLYLPMMVVGYVFAVPFFVLTVRTSQKKGQKASLMTYVAVAFVCYIGVLALLLVGSVSRGRMTKGLLGAAIGLFLGCIGNTSQFSVNRFTFGVRYLDGGISFIVTMIGLFGAGEALYQLSIETPVVKQDVPKRIVPPFRTILKHLPLTLFSSVLGIFVGALPGAGGGFQREGARDGVAEFGRAEVLERAGEHVVGFHRPLRARSSSTHPGRSS